MAVAPDVRLAQKREANARYRAAHPERIRVYLASWNARNGKAYRARHRDQALARARVRNIERHGLTVDQYEALLAAQGGVCAICGRAESVMENGRLRRLDVDHDHACCPGRTSCGACIRGLLCNGCNRGVFGFDPAVLRVAADYFERSTSRV